MRKHHLGALERARLTEKNPVPPAIVIGGSMAKGIGHETAE
jgi:hypothetical protein